MTHADTPTLDAAELDELARKANKAREAWNAYADATDTAAGNDAHVDYLVAFAAFQSACTPTVTLGLLAAVQSGEAETARLTKARDAWRDYAEHVVRCVECCETSPDRCSEGGPLLIAVLALEHP